ncbi:hypothetical protein SORBI_3001G332300 [Sorghum bicolor]|uniref:Uncharacterized protein n=1 Tax=Sorghum bicolor TaxID=4558 RepID=A0A1Z5S8W0_SORBI|nr:hypothetical protein SORBI_3001G332300 [Sorghum bicolor]
MFGTHLFLQRMGATAILLKKMLTSDTLTLQNPTEGSRHMEGDSSQAYGLLFLGFLSFLPGFYETRVAYYSWRGAPGYTFASIPDY